MPVAKVGAEQNVSTGYARRRRRDTAMDGGSIPPISTNPLSREWARPALIRGTGPIFLHGSLSLRVTAELPAAAREICTLGGVAGESDGMVVRRS